MEAYTEFAQVYDRFMDNVPYEAWCEGISKILTEHGISEGLVLDLGCGTGTMTRLLRQKGYDMIGVDASAEMLEIARNHPDEGICICSRTCGSSSCTELWRRWCASAIP